jgi:hypothetical protein
MGFSLIAEGLLRAYLPETHWRPLISKLGYAFGALNLAQQISLLNAARKASALTQCWNVSAQTSRWPRRLGRHDPADLSATSACRMESRSTVQSCSSPTFVFTADLRQCAAISRT